LFMTTLTEFGIHLEEVVIINIREGVFYANLVCKNNGEEKIIDARPSDAISLAIRFKCPLYTTESVLRKAGIIMQEESQEKDISVSEHHEPDEPHEQETANPIERASEQELNDMMMKAISNEDYELAAKIRDEIEKRRK
jgi:uncharacterized protein